MIRLKRIENSDGIVKCAILPEDSEREGRLEYNTKTDDIKYELPEGYEYCEPHVAQAVYWIRKNVNRPLPEEKTIMWY